LRARSTLDWSQSNNISCVRFNVASAHSISLIHVLTHVWRYFLNFCSLFFFFPTFASVILLFGRTYLSTVLMDNWLGNRNSA